MATEGTVKVWNIAKGYGFVTADGDGTEAFVHFSVLSGPGLEQGKRVTYDVEKPVGKGKKLVAVNVSGEGVLTADEEKGPLHGTVKLWVSGRSMGLIRADTGEDVHVHSSAFGGGSLDVGKRVTYNVRPELHLKSKKKIACNVSGEGVIPVGKHKGVIKAWVAAKGYGFAETDDGSEIYIHRSSLSDGHCLSGKLVYFDIETQSHESGRLLAKNVTGPAVRPGSALDIPVSVKGHPKGGKGWHVKGGKGWGKKGGKGGKGSKKGW